MAKQKKKRSPAARRVRWILGTIFRALVTVFLVCVITGCIVGCVLTVYILDYVGTLEDIDIRNIDLNYTSIIYANDDEGNPYELSRIHGDENRIWVDYEQMPSYLTDVTIATEDKRFLEHHGVDWKRTAAAAINMFIPILDRQEGGSTITQQLIKNATDNWAPNVERKVKEIFSALKLEKKYSKTDIMEAYLNVASFGNNTNGVQAAANLYFNKDVSELSLVECAAIVCTTQSPTKYDLFRNPEANAERRNKYIFPTMLELGMISQEEYEQAINTEVRPERSQAPGQQTNSSNTWFVDHVIEDVIDGLMEKEGMDYSSASSMLFRSGLHIYTTVDNDMQTYLEEVYTDLENTFPPIRNTIYPESAFIVMDLHGQIKAVVGSNRPKQGNRWLNYATQEPRQPGSTMKPISAYLQGIEQDLITWSTVIEDSPITYKDEVAGTETQWPVNYYGYYDGNHPCVYALQRSINTIPVKLMQLIGPQVSLNFLHDKCGMKNLVTPEEDPRVNDNNLSAMAIGGTTKGVTLLELAGAYQIDANGGTYTKPTSYTRVYDRENSLLLEADTTATRVISKETSSILNLMMQQVVSTAPGTGTAARFTGDLAGMPVAGKTGTSSDNKDQWFVGITPYYIGVTWMGYAPVAQPINYIQFPTPIVWRNVMQPIHEGLPVIDFDYSQNIVQKQYCVETGDLATEDCPSQLMGWYKTTNIPDVCTEHVGVKDSEEEEDDDGSRSSSKKSSSKKSSSSSRAGNTRRSSSNRD
ncbi:transglycosylase domain-containing protein [Provencibacterium massiliense]|uniref:transglycosylase domain-containing protein n=1 Tax=Provencibacterium massiliense TaxID=1841868 RepID=UPI0013564006|nr:transglycosylase domain-containing protein [Provencibacterium massiliense]